MKVTREWLCFLPNLIIATPAGCFQAGQTLILSGQWIDGVGPVA